MSMESGQVRSRLGDQRYADIQYEGIEALAAILESYLRSIGLQPEVAKSTAERMAQEQAGVPPGAARPGQSRRRQVPNPARKAAMDAAAAKPRGVGDDPIGSEINRQRRAAMDAAAAMPEFIDDPNDTGPQPGRAPGAPGAVPPGAAAQGFNPWGPAPLRQAALDPAQMAAYNLSNPTPAGMNAAQVAAHRQANGIPDYADPGKLFAEAREQSARGAGDFPAAAAAYMSPYQRAVTDKIRSEGLQTFKENILPALEARFVKAGTHGGSRHATLAERAARDIQEKIMHEQAQSLHQGYGQAAQTFNSDQLRRIANAENLKGLGLAGQSSNLANIGALNEAGRMRQEHGQQARDIGFQDWMRQREEPNLRVNQLLAGIRGAHVPMTQEHFSYTPPQAYLNRSGQYGSAVGQMLGGLMQQPRPRYKHGGRVTLNLGGR